MKFFGKPIKFLKRKKDKEYSEILKENLDKLVPQYLEAHDLETRDKYLADRQRYLQEISLEVYKQVEGDIKEIKENSLINSAKIIFNDITPAFKTKTNQPF